MKQKLLSIVLALSLCLGLLPSTALAAEEHTCADEDGDYWCDVCWEIMEHACADEDGDYWCDVCWEIMEHACADADEDGDYWCDVCWEVIEHTCVDVLVGAEDPADHFCALCWAHMSELCEDEDGSHACDTCWVIMEWLCSNEDGDHACDNENCANRLSDCEDTEGDDNICDICGKGIYPGAGELNVEDEGGNGTITVTWSALEDVGMDRVASYTVYCYDAEGDMADAVTKTYAAAEAPFTHTFTGLTNYVTYSVGVCASYTGQPDGEDSQYTATMEILATLSFTDLWVGGVQFTSEKLTIEDGEGGNAIYDPDTNTLTLNGVEIAAGYEYEDNCTAAIYADGDLNIVLEGTSKITAPGAAEQTIGIYVEGDLSISGSGSMTCVGGVIESEAAGRVASTGIFIGGDFSISEASVTAEGGKIDAGNCAVRSIGVSSCGSIDIDFEGSLEAIGGAATGKKSYSCGVEAYGGEDNYINIAVRDGYLKAIGGNVTGAYYAGSHGIFAQFGGLYTYSDCSSVIATGGNAATTNSEAEDYSPYAFSNGISVYGGDVGIDAGTVTITSGSWESLDGDGWAVYVEGHTDDDGVASGGTVTIGCEESALVPAPGYGFIGTNVIITAENQEEGYAIYAQMGIEIGDVLTISVPEGGKPGSLGVSDDETIMDSIVDADNNLAQNVTVKVVDNSKHFMDVHPVNHEAESAIDFVSAHGLMNGYGNGYFGPDDNLSRGMLAQILYNLEGRPAVSSEMPFSDVTEDRYYYDAVKWAAENGIVGGYGNGAFGPDDNTTRQQLAAMLYRYEQYRGGGFTGAWMFRMDYTDLADISDWAYEPLCWMTMHGVMDGYGNGLLGPKDNTTRAQAAQILMNYLVNVL